MSRPGHAEPVLATLGTLAADARMVFLAGLPGTGKSLLLRDLAERAHARGRRVQLLQWDVVRPAFEASPVGRRYPQAGGVTHGVIRLAVGRWARQAIADWAGAATGDILLGETPLIGHRLVDLAHRRDDAAEPLLADSSTRFLIPVPSGSLRAHLEAERARRMAAPGHPREREDAPPHVLAALWRELATVAVALGLADRPPPGAAPPYDPDTYRRVYEVLLRHRRVEALDLDVRLDTGGRSAYDLRAPTTDLLPSPPEADRLITAVAARFADPAVLDRTIADWYRIP